MQNNKEQDVRKVVLAMPLATYHGQEYVDNLRALGTALLKAAQVLNRYCGRGYFLRWFTSGSDEDDLESVASNLDVAMRALVEDYVLETIVAKDKKALKVYELRRAMCREAGMDMPKTWTADFANKVLEKLKKDKPDELEKLMKELGGVRDSSMVDELSYIDFRLKELEAKVQQHDQQLQQQGQQIQELIKGLANMTTEKILEVMNEFQNRPPAALAAYLQDWWDSKDYLKGKLKSSVKCGVFLDAIVTWVTNNKSDGLATLKEYDEALLEEQPALLSEVSSGSIQGRLFLEEVFIKLADLDGDSNVSRKELLACQIKAEMFAQDNALATPNDWFQMLKAIFLGFDRTSLSATLPGPGSSPGEQQQPAAGGEDSGLALPEIVQLTGALSIIASYKITTLLEEYIHGTR